MRTFETGATRDSNENKPDFKGYLSPTAIKRFGAYMLKHQVQADGQRRSSDNWKKGMPITAYVESLIRHTVDFWDLYEQGKLDEADEMACAMWFNLQGYLHERGKVALQKEIEEEPKKAATQRQVFCCRFCVHAYGSTRWVYQDVEGTIRESYNHERHTCGGK